jgi:hypothetical protein
MDVRRFFEYLDEDVVSIWPSRLVFEELLPPKLSGFVSNTSRMSLFFLF